MSTTVAVKVNDDPPKNLSLGVANGMPGPLDGTGKLPSSQIPGGGGGGGTSAIVVDNGDGTFTLTASSSALTDNGDGTFTLTA